METAELREKLENEIHSDPGECTLTSKQQIFCLLSVAISLNYKVESRLFFAKALKDGIDSDVLEELTLQCYLFAGFPAAIEGLFALKEALEKTEGIKKKLKKDPRNRVKIRRDGLALCRSVYAENFERLMDHMETLSVDLSEWMIEEGYGKVLSRPLLNPIERELATVSALTALRMPHQLHAHVRGALNVGAKPRAVTESIMILKPLIGIPPVMRALETVEKVNSKRSPS